MNTLTVEQLSSLLGRARARRDRRVTFYVMDDVLVEVTPTKASRKGLDGPREHVINPDGSVAR